MLRVPRNSCPKDAAKNIAAFRYLIGYCWEDLCRDTIIRKPGAGLPRYKGSRPVVAGVEILPQMHDGGEDAVNYPMAGDIMWCVEHGKLDGA